jgi:hypothetical protein
MYQDHKDLLSAFAAHGVKYLIVGGYAVIFHAQPRFTKHIDLLVKPDSENAKAVFAALAGFGAPLKDLRWEDFTESDSFFRFGHDPHGFDILLHIPGVDFEYAWSRRIEGVIDPPSGLIANFISADDLIAAKLASGRPQDLADADAVKQAQLPPKVEKKQ